MSLCKKLQFKSSHQTKVSFKYLLLTSVNTLKLNSQSFCFSKNISPQLYAFHDKLFLGLRLKFSNLNLKKLLNIDATSNNRIKFLKSSTLLASFSRPGQKLNEKQINYSENFNKFKHKIDFEKFNKKLSEKSRYLINKLIRFYKEFALKLEDLKFNFEFSRNFTKKYFLSFSTTYGFFTWNDYKISDEDIRNEINEILTIFNVQNEQENSITESGEIKINFQEARLIENEEWKLIYDKKDLLIWRRNISLSDDDEEDIKQDSKNSTNEKPNYDLYEYKVLGRFNDITPIEFYLTQTDLEYRKEWDYLAVSLDVLSKDQITKTELVKWIMRFPYPLYPREYVFVRRYCIDPEEKLLILVSKSVPNVQIDLSKLNHEEQIVHKDHENNKSGVNKHHHVFHNQSATEFVRVTKYKSNIIVLPHGDFDKPGLDYVIQYYDINKAKIPKLAYKWMATSGLPDYIDKVHKAAIKLKHRNENIHTNESELLNKFEIFNLNKKSDIVEPSKASFGTKIEVNSSVDETKSQIIEIKQIDTVQNDQKSIDNIIKIYFFIVLENLTNDFFSVDEPHPIFYN